jgi:hypothetical protein
MVIHEESPGDQHFSFLQHNLTKAAVISVFITETCDRLIHIISWQAIELFLQNNKRNNNVTFLCSWDISL